ncbi:baeRF2 domain-containing protein [Saccharopolyspora phatthalungensis]|uniref:Peptide chain release factor 2 n=1 Tax=Saccharopolyspora phatthalungensis TaxID=664693 RepID=A0A840QI10_9PSEU|nr:hypothetical protein [Saccharopolyspora phatthalungensis]MBB5158458.1 hypothetical protein [Saccharopolyspora phatthalungensis]
MELTDLRKVYQHEGPFATVYLEGRSPGDDAAGQIRLRWKSLRERLLAEGASQGAVEAIASELERGTPGEEQANGRVLVATESGVVLDERWDAALGAGDDAHWGVLPELGAYVRERARSVRELVVIADQEGAQVRQEVVAEYHEPHELDAEIVEGSADEGVHKPRGGALSHNRIQRRADEAVGRNAKDIAAHVSAVATEFRPGVVVLAGEVQARTAVREELPAQLAELIIETDRGGRDENASEEALVEELLRIAHEAEARRAERTAGQLAAGLAHDRAVAGHKEVARAAEMGAVETLLLESDIPASREAFLLNVCAETSAAVTLVPDGTGLTDGVGALLRFPVTG